MTHAMGTLMSTLPLPPGRGPGSLAFPRLARGHSAGQRLLEDGVSGSTRPDTNTRPQSIPCRPWPPAPDQPPLISSLPSAAPLSAPALPLLASERKKQEVEGSLLAKGADVGAGHPSPFPTGPDC